MASSKKRNKWKAMERKERRAGQPARPHPDGDRRRRGLSETVDEALRRKRLERQAWLDQPTGEGGPDEPSEDHL